MRVESLPFCLVLLWSATAACADPPPASGPFVRLEYTRPDECPDEAYLRRVLAGEFGYDPVLLDGTKLLRIAITQEESDFVGRVTILTPDDVTVWNEQAGGGLSCTDAVRGAAYSARMGILGPLVLERDGRVSESRVSSVSETTTGQDSRNQEKPMVNPTAPWRPRIDVGLGPFVAFARTPSDVAPGISLFAGLRQDWFSFVFDGRAVLPFPSTEVRLGNGTKTEIQSVFVSAALAPCAHFLKAFFVCIPFEIGSRRFYGEDGVVIRSGDRPSLAVGARFGGTLRLGGPWYLRTFGEILGATEDILRFDENHEIWRSSLIQGLLSTAVGVSL